VATATVGIVVCAFLGAWTTGGPAWPFVKLLLVFSLMVLLLRGNVLIGLALLVGAVALGVSFQLSAVQLIHGFTLGLFDPLSEALDGIAEKALRLGLMVFLINLLGQMLILSGRIHKLIEALERLFGDVRWVMAAIPAAIGLLPMPGGAMLSAPIVGEFSGRLKVGPAEKTVANYWFRHVWEWWWPLFPAILIVVSDGYLSLAQVLMYQGPFTVGAVVLGWFFLLRKIERPRAQAVATSPIREIGRVVGVLWPMLAAVATVLLVHPPEPFDRWVLPVSLAVVNAVLALRIRLKRADLLGALKRAGQWRIFLLVFGVYVLRAVFELSHAAERLPAALQAFHVPGIAACFLVPFAINLITGYNVAGVGMAFPLLVALFAKTGPVGVTVAYAGAFLGVLSSPIHLCLALTREYFHAEWGRVYRLLIPMLLGMAAIAVLIGWVGSCAF